MLFSGFRKSIPDPGTKPKTWAPGWGKFFLFSFYVRILVAIICDTRSPQALAPIFFPLSVSLLAVQPRSTHDRIPSQFVIVIMKCISITSERYSHYSLILLYHSCYKHSLIHRRTEMSLRHRDLCHLSASTVGLVLWHKERGLEKKSSSLSFLSTASSSFSLESAISSFMSDIRSSAKRQLSQSMRWYAR